MALGDEVMDAVTQAMSAVMPLMAQSMEASAFIAKAKIAGEITAAIMGSMVARGGPEVCTDGVTREAARLGFVAATEIYAQGRAALAAAQEEGGK